MKTSYRFRITALITIATLAMFIGAPVSGAFGLLAPAFFLTISGTFINFLMLLEIRHERVLKGIYLVAAGVLFQLFYMRFFLLFVDASTIPKDISEQFEVFGQVMLLACSGAGGSIIAAHADRSSKDYVVGETNTAIIDNTKQIQDLIESTAALHQKLDRVIAVSVISALVIIVIALLRH